MTNPSTGSVRAITGALIDVEGTFESGMAVLVDGDRITGVHGLGDLPVGIPQEDWGNVAILPGTINGHGHGFHSIFKGFGADIGNPRWSTEVMYPVSEQLSKQDIYFSAVMAFSEAMRAGVTTTVDFFYIQDEGNENAEQVIQAAKDVGIRLVLARTFYDISAPNAAPRRFREEPAEAEERLRELHKRYSSDNQILVQPAAHSLRGSSIETAHRVARVAADLGTPWHIHIHENTAGRAQLTEQWGTTPTRLLAAEGLIGPDLVVVHGTWLDEDEVALIAEGGASVVHCAATSMFFGAATAPIVDMLSRGIGLALGFDGAAGNNRQSIFDEMRMASLLAKQRGRDATALGAETAFRLGTRGGAATLQVDAGAIRSGLFADFVAIDLEDLSLQPLASLREQIVYSMQSTAIAKVMCGGRITFEHGRLTQVDERDLGRWITSRASEWAHLTAQRK